jgi:RsiW-degrading membrane proteinase PrsW (M82 family)
MSASVTPTSPSPDSSAPHWGVQASIFQLRQPAFWLFVALLGIGGYLFVDEQSLMSKLPEALILSWALVLVYAIPVLLLVYRLDLFEREPWQLLVAALLWGGIIATSLAGEANSAWLSIMSKVAPLDMTAQWGPAIVGPGVEETLKLMGVVTLFLIVPAEFDGVMDGFVYGALVGLGFTVVEDVSYFINAAVASGGAGDQVGPVIDSFLIRVVGGGLYSHVLFTGITGLGFAYLVTRPKAARARGLLGFGACLVAGVAAHATWNSPWMQTVLSTASGTDKPSTFQWIEYGALKGLPFLIILILLVLFATRSEEKNFRAIVAPEPDPQIITEVEITSLGSLWSRRAARTAAGHLRGRQGSLLAGQLQAAQIEFAMILSRTDSLTDPALEAQRVRIRTIRAQLAAVAFVPVSVRPAPPTVAAPAPVAPVVEPVPVVAPVAPIAAAASPAVAPVAPVVEPVPVVASVAPVVEPVPVVAPVAAPVVAPVVEPVAAAASLVAEPRPAPAPISALEPAPKTEPQPEPAPAPIAAAPPQAPAWAPTHLVPPGGMAAWNAPDPSRPPMLNLPERLELVVEGRAGGWAQVRAVNGWRGWVDGRRLVDRA